MIKKLNGGFLLYARLQKSLVHSFHKNFNLNYLDSIFTIYQYWNNFLWDVLLPFFGKTEITNPAKFLYVSYNRSIVKVYVQNSNKYTYKDNYSRLANESPA